MLSRFAHLRIALSAAKRLTVNSAKHLLLGLEKQTLRFAQGDNHFGGPGRVGAGVDRRLYLPLR